MASTTERCVAVALAENMGRMLCCNNWPCQGFRVQPLRGGNRDSGFGIRKSADGLGRLLFRIPNPESRIPAFTYIALENRVASVGFR